VLLVPVAVPDLCKLVPLQDQPLVERVGELAVAQVLDLREVAVSMPMAMAAAAVLLVEPQLVGGPTMAAVAAVVGPTA
jgi:hypothetical protein